MVIATIHFIKSLARKMGGVNWILPVASLRRRYSDLFIDSPYAYDGLEQSYRE